MQACEKGHLSIIQYLLSKGFHELHIQDTLVNLFLMLYSLIMIILIILYIVFVNRFNRMLCL